MTNAWTPEVGDRVEVRGEVMRLRGRLLGTRGAVKDAPYSIRDDSGNPIRDIPRSALFRLVEVVEMDAPHLDGGARALDASEALRDDGCPKCGAAEVDSATPRTTYACGSSSYDDRNGTLSGPCAEASCGLPTWETCEAACEHGNETPLHRFLYENEPPEAGFRKQLAEALREARVQGMREGFGIGYGATDPQGAILAAIEAARKGER